MSEETTPDEQEAVKDLWARYKTFRAKYGTAAAYAFIVGCLLTELKSKGRDLFYEPF